MAISTETALDTPTTGVAAGNEFQVLNRPVTICLDGASLGDVVARLQRYTAAGNWIDQYDDNGAIDLSATRTSEIVWGGGAYRLNYTTRGSSVGSSATSGPGGR